MPLHYIPHAYIGKNQYIGTKKYIILLNFSQKKNPTQSQEQLYHTLSIQAKDLKHS